MQGFSTLTVLGNITRDIELRYTGDGTAVTDICIAINKKYKGKESTVFLDCTVWGKTAETCGEYLSKGDPVLFSGEIEQDSWDDKNGGGKRTKIKMSVHKFQFINNRNNEDGGNNAEKNNKQDKLPEKNYNEGFGDDDFGSGEEIPF